MNILVVDPEERGRIIAEIMGLEALKMPNVSQLLQVFWQKGTSLKIYNFESNDWDKTNIHPENLSLRLRHDSGEELEFPKASIQIKYSGMRAGSNHSETEFGIPLQILSSPEEAEKTFTAERAQSLLNFALQGGKGTFPQFRRVTFDQVLEDKIAPRWKELKNAEWETLPFFITEFFKKYIHSGVVKILIIWPGSEEKEMMQVLSQIDPDKKKTELTKYQIQVIQTKSEWDTLSHCAHFDLAVIPSELVWDSTHQRTEFLGIIECSNLRRKHFSGITILASVVPSVIARLLLLDKISPDFEILNTGYNYLWDISENQDGGLSCFDLEDNLEATTKAWNDFKHTQDTELEALSIIKTHKMPVERLEDVRYHLLPAGRLSSIYHEVKTLVINTTIPKITLIDSVKSAFKDIRLLISPACLLDYEEMVNATITQMENSANTSESYLIFLSTQPKVASFLPADDPEANMANKKTVQIQKEWGVLCLEDDDDTANIIINLLENENGIPCWRARNAEQALELLKKDSNGELVHDSLDDAKVNFITLVLVDIRLQNTGRWQLRQGYEFINELSHLDNYVACIALTQKESFIMRSIRHRKDTSTIWFSKEVLRMPGTQEILVKKIFDMGGNMFDALSSVPKTALWLKGYKAIHDYRFKDIYKWHRTLANYEQREAEIRETAEYLFTLWRLLKESPQSPMARRAKSELDSEVPLQVTKIKKGILAPKSEKDSNIILNSPVAVETNDIIEPEKDSNIILNLFSIKLSARRTAIAIYSYYKWAKPQNFDREIFLSDLVPEICIFLNKQNIDSDDDRNDIDLTLLNKHLGFTTDAHQWVEQMLVEEKNWLKEFSGTWQQ